MNRERGCVRRCSAAFPFSKSRRKAGIFHMKKIAKFIVKGIDHMVNLIALLLVLMTMFLSCYMLWDSNQVYQAADAKNYEAYIPTEKHTKSFEELQKINPDVIGWIRVNDTNINYPLLQTDDDDTYMNTDAEGKYSLSGASFCIVVISQTFQMLTILFMVTTWKRKRCSVILVILRMRHILMSIRMEIFSLTEKIMESNSMH